MQYRYGENEPHRRQRDYTGDIIHACHHTNLCRILGRRNWFAFVDDSAVVTADHLTLNVRLSDLNGYTLHVPGGRMRVNRGCLPKPDKAREYSRSTLSTERGGEMS